MSSPPSALRERRSFRGLLSAIGLGVSYYALGRADSLLAVEPGGAVCFLPTAGLALAWFVRSPRSRWPLLAVAVLVAGSAAHLVDGIGGAASLGYAGAALAGALVAAGLLTRVVGGQVDLGQTRSVLALAGVSAVAGGLAATIGAGVATVTSAPLPGGWLLEWGAVALGTLCVGAAALAITGVRRRDIRGGAEAAGLLCAVTAVSASVFLAPAWDPVPLLSFTYLPVLLVVAAALRVGPWLTALLALLVSALASAGLAAGRGPFVRVGRTPEREVLELQGFVYVATLVALLVAAEVARRRRSERAALIGEAHYRSLIRSMPAGLTVESSSGGIIDCNRAAEEILGLSREQLLGREHVDPRWMPVREDGSPFPPAELPAAAVVASGTAVRDVIVGVHKPDGSRTWVSVSAEPLRLDDAPVAVCSFTDVTERVNVQHEQEYLSRLTTLVASEAEPRRVFDAVTRDSAAALEAEAAGLIRFDEGRTFGSLLGAWTDDPNAGPSFGVRLHLDDGAVTGTVATTKAPAHRGGAPGDAGHTCFLMPGRAVSATLAVPITVDGALWGALAVATTTRGGFGRDAGQRLARLGEIATLAIISADARSQLATLASTDHLTGLWNRRAFQERLSAELDRARRHQRSLSLIVMDLDHFKLVNDTYGHLEGDRVLIEVARRLGGLVREGEVISRVGGEEFAWILPETDGAAAIAAAERLRRAISSEPFAGVGQITLSLGTCGLEDAGAAADIFRLADVALYWAKAQGRNRVVRYSPETFELLSASEQGHRLERARSFARVEALARAVDAKDPSTQRHSERVADLARRLAASSAWSAEAAERLHQAALVHDVGKIAIPESILLKPGSLTAAEYERVKEHSHIGVTMLEDALAPDQLAWVRGHHERHDGSGYPDGLSGGAIPDGARLLALADAWDAMTVARPYGAPRTTAGALEECRQASGSQFAPAAVGLLEELLERDAQDLLLAGGSAGS